jgi:hypothetical protein
MSLLTKEQEETLEQSRQRHEQWRGDCDAHTAEVLALVDIVDDLQARAPKQYTEQELREWFENRPLVQDEIDALLHEVVPGENEAWYSVLKFAAHVGALKAEP